MDDLEGKRSFPILRAKRHCGLKFNALLVYSWRVWKLPFHKDKSPTVSATASGTGISTETVSNALHDLMALNLYDDCGLHPPPKDWFISKTNNTGKWQNDFAYWTNFVRATNSPLTTSATAMYSYLRHCSLSGFKARYGFTNSHIASVLRTHRDTIAKAKLQLTDCGLIRLDGDGEIVVCGVGISEREWFASSGEPNIDFKKPTIGPSVRFEPVAPATSAPAPPAVEPIADNRDSRCAILEKLGVEDTETRFLAAKSLEVCPDGQVLPVPWKSVLNELAKVYSVRDRVPAEVVRRELEEAAACNRSFLIRDK